ncbi:hypothetical protein RB195_007462 [Necator americanus]|uniref:Uncharacterized protein n=1 Tax=Necator americanus TaxID=51031 RepID=A0ABR1BYM5_NECAM
MYGSQAKGKQVLDFAGKTRPRANSFTNNDHNRQTENSLEVTVNSFDGLWKESKRFHSKVFSLKKNEKFQ